MLAWGYRAIPVLMGDFILRRNRERDGKRKRRDTHASSPKQHDPPHVQSRKRPDLTHQGEALGPSPSSVFFFFGREKKMLKKPTTLSCLPRCIQPLVSLCRAGSTALSREGNPPHNLCMEPHEHEAGTVSMKPAAAGAEVSTGFTFMAPVR